MNDSMEDLSDPGRGDDGGKSRRVRKKSAKVLEMEEFEEAEKKQFGKREAPKGSKSVSMATVATPGMGPPSKRSKLKLTESLLVGGLEGEAMPEDFMASPTTPPAKPKVVALGSQVVQQAVVTGTGGVGVAGSAAGGQGSVIKLLLSSPTIPTNPSVSTKALTKNPIAAAPLKLPISPTATAQVAAGKKGGKGRGGSGGEGLGSPVSPPLVMPMIKTEIKKEPDQDLKLKLFLGAGGAAGTPGQVAVSQAGLQAALASGASTSNLDTSSLKVKLLLSPKEKTVPGHAALPTSLGTVSTAHLELPSGGEKPAKKPRKKKEGDPAKPKPKAKGKTQALGTTGLPPQPTVSKLAQRLSAKLLASPSSGSEQFCSEVEPDLLDPGLDLEGEAALVIAEDALTPKATKRKAPTPGGRKKKQKMALSGEGVEEFAAEGDIAALAAKVKRTGDKKQGKKSKKEEKEEMEAAGKKKKRAPTAYMLWCSEKRNKIVAENPGIDFAHISRKLGEIWQTLPKKDKLGWKRKAKKIAGKGSTLISTGKGSKAAAAAISQASSPAPALVSTPHSSGRVASQPASRTPRTSSDDTSLSPVRGFGTEPVDVAAHLKLLGESLSIIGMRLQEHKGLIAVQGSLSVLLDSLLCAFGPLMCLVQQVPELDGCPAAVHSNTLDSIAYFMPGL